MKMGLDLMDQDANFSKTDSDTKNRLMGAREESGWGTG